MTTQKTYLADICWTLYKSNTTQDFIDFVVSDPTYLRLRRMYRHRLFRRALHVWFRLTGTDPWRRYVVSRLQGMSRKQLRDSSEAFIHSLENKKVKEVWKLLDKADEIVLVSSTLGPVAQAVAKQMPVPPVMVTASGLEYENEIFTGHIADDKLKCKLTDEQLSQWKPFTVITDNFTDLNIIAQAEEAYIVTYNNRPLWQHRLGRLGNLPQIHYIETDGEHY